MGGRVGYLGLVAALGHRSEGVRRVFGGYLEKHSDSVYRLFEGSFRAYFLRAVGFLLNPPTTQYLLPILPPPTTYHLPLPTTYYLLPTTRYLPPTTTTRHFTTALHPRTNLYFFRINEAVSERGSDSRKGRLSQQFIAVYSSLQQHGSETSLVRSAPVASEPDTASPTRKKDQTAETIKTRQDDRVTGKKKEFRVSAEDNGIKGTRTKDARQWQSWLERMLANLFTRGSSPADSAFFSQKKQREG